MPLMGTRDGSGNVRGGDGEKEGVGGKGSGITSTSNNHALDGHELVDVIGVEFAHVGGLLHVEGPHLDGPEALLVLFEQLECCCTRLHAKGRTIEWFFGHVSLGL